MPKIVTRGRKQRGFILITHTLMIGLTMGMVGLAVDAGTMYVIKGRLSSAIDAAALAAGRSVNLANTVAAAQTAAQTTATTFFNANFPSGYLGSGAMSLTTPSFVQAVDANGNPTGSLNISITASVPAPTYFIRVLNVIPGMSVPGSVTVSSTGTATRRSTVMILVLDTSTSMNAGSPQTACQAMVAAAQNFITNFSPYDTIGAVQFGYTASILYAPSTNFGDGSLNTALGSIGCNDNTNTTSGLWLAYEQIKSVGLPLAYNSIVLFTDGSPNGITANFPVRTNADFRFGPNVTIPGVGSSCGNNTTQCTPPIACTAAATVAGTISQTSGQPDDGDTQGLWIPVATNPPTNSTPAISYPPGCNSALINTLAPINNSAPVNVRQLVAYIPDFDLYGNSTHGVPTTQSGPTCPGAACTVATVTLGSTGASYTYDTRDFWRFQCNNVCTGATGSAATACSTDSTPGQQYEGGVWSYYSADTNSNFFPSSNSFYANFMRPDQPNTIVAASMNSAMSEAYWIRKDSSGCPGMGSLGTNGTACTTKYHPVINTIYLLGNAGDQADHEFLPIMSNVQTIPALPYDSSWTPYNNPAYQIHEETGLYQVTADKTQLTVLFQALASEVLRLSN
jgi:hypothetical protein